MPSLGAGGKGALYFTESVILGRILLFLITIGAVLLLPKHLVCMFVCFVFVELCAVFMELLRLLSTVESLFALTIWNQGLQSRDSSTV